MPNDKCHNTVTYLQLSCTRRLNALARNVIVLTNKPNLQLIGRRCFVVNLFCLHLMKWRCYLLLYYHRTQLFFWRSFVFCLNDMLSCHYLSSSTLTVEGEGEVVTEIGWGAQALDKKGNLCSWKTTSLDIKICLECKSSNL